MSVANAATKGSGSEASRVRWSRLNGEPGERMSGCRQDRERRSGEIGCAGSEARYSATHQERSRNGSFERSGRPCEQVLSAGPDSFDLHSPRSLRLRATHPPSGHDDSRKEHDLPLVRRRRRGRGALFHAETFPDSAVTAVHRAPGDYPDGQEGDVLTVQFTVLGIPCLGLKRRSPLHPRRGVLVSGRGPRIRPRQTATGTRSSATAGRRARAAGARTDGACPGRSRRSP